MSPRNNSIKHSFSCASRGVASSFKSQRNLRVQASIGTIAAVLAVTLRLNWTEWAILTLTIVLVLVSELFNTAIEATVDLASPGYHDVARIAKDAAAGATLVAAIGSILVGIFLFLPKIIAAI